MQALTEELTLGELIIKAVENYVMQKKKAGK